MLLNSVHFNLKHYLIRKAINIFMSTKTVIFLIKISFISLEYRELC